MDFEGGLLSFVPQIHWLQETEVYPSHNNTSYSTYGTVHMYIILQNTAG